MEITGYESEVAKAAQRIAFCQGVTIAPREDGGPTLRELVEAAKDLVKVPSGQRQRYLAQQKMSALLAHFKIDGGER